MSYTAPAFWYLLLLVVAAVFAAVSVVFYRGGQLVGAMGCIAGSAFVFVVGMPSVAKSRVTLSEDLLEVRGGPWYDQKIDRFNLATIAGVRLGAARGSDGKSYDAVIVTLTNGSIATFPRTMVWKSNEGSIFSELKKRNIQTPQ